MSAYFDFLDRIEKSKIKTIFELGSRDLQDAIKLSNYFEDSKLYAFECNPDCLEICHTAFAILDEKIKKRLFLINKAVSSVNGQICFYPFDLQLYDNMGASSMLEIDFSMRHPSDPDFNRENPQKEIKVDGVRLDTFLKDNNISNIDLLCMDLQGYELQALQSLGKYLIDVKYIITECSIQSTYKNGASFQELEAYLECFGFHYVCSNKFGERRPDLSQIHFSEFDALFQKK